MRAARLHEYTEEMADALTIEDVPRPEIGASDQVVVEVEGAGGCQTDNHIIEGMWEPYADQSLPMTLGHENAGTVVEVGDEVTTVDVGDSVRHVLIAWSVTFKKRLDVPGTSRFEEFQIDAIEVEEDSADVVLRQVLVDDYLLAEALVERGRRVGIPDGGTDVVDAL